jgi:hypothetical protein
MVLYSWLLRLSVLLPLPVSLLSSRQGSAVAIAVVCFLSVIHQDLLLYLPLLFLLSS